MNQIIQNLGFNRVDIVICFFALFFGLIGLFKGAIRQFFSILSFVFATIASIVVPCFIKLPFLDSAQPAWGQIILSVLVWLPSYFILSIIGKFIAGRMLKQGVRLGDHIWGLFFGALKGFTYISVIIFLIDSFPLGISKAAPELDRQINESRIYSIIAPYNPFLKLHIIQNLNMVISAINDPDYMEILSKDPNFKELLKQKSIDEIIYNPELKKMLADHQYIKFMTAPEIRQLIKDQEALRILLSTDVDDTVVKNI